MPSSSNHNPHFVAPAVAGAPAVQPASFSSPQEEIDISAPNGPAVGAMPLQSALQNPAPLSMPPTANIPGGNNPYGTNSNAPHAQGYLQNSASIQGMHLQAQQRPASLVALELMERNKQLQYDLETLQRNNEALVNELNENNALMDQTRQQVTDYLQLIENQKNEIIRLSSALQRLQQESAGMKRQYEMEIKAVGDEVDKMLMQQILDK